MNYPTTVELQQHRFDTALDRARDQYALYIEATELVRRIGKAHGCGHAWMKAYDRASRRLQAFKAAMAG